MLKKFLGGLAFGAGFTIAAVAILWLISWFSVVRIESGFDESGRSEISDPPAIPTQTRRYLGTTGRSSGDFDRNDWSILRSGDGAIEGTVTANGSPVQGLRIRLLLNGSAKTEWVASDGNGRYTVTVPYGDYRMDGYDIDYGTAMRVLPGKTDDPRSVQLPKRIQVSEGNRGSGVELRYVDPVVVTGPFGDVPFGGIVTLTWESYSGAQPYRLQIYEVPDSNVRYERRSLFEWTARPEVSGTSFDLTIAGVELQVGFSYLVEVEALNAQRSVIGDTGVSATEPQFRVVD